MAQHEYGPGSFVVNEMLTNDVSSVRPRSSSLGAQETAPAGPFTGPAEPATSPNARPGLRPRNLLQPLPLSRANSAASLADFMERAQATQAAVQAAPAETPRHVAVRAGAGMSPSNAPPTRKFSLQGFVSALSPRDRSAPKSPGGTAAFESPRGSPPLSPTGADPSPAVGSRAPLTPVYANVDCILADPVVSRTFMEYLANKEGYRCESEFLAVFPRFMDANAPEARSIAFEELQGPLRGMFGARSEASGISQVQLDVVFSSDKDNIPGSRSLLIDVHRQVLTHLNREVLADFQRAQGFAPSVMPEQASAGSASPREQVGSPSMRAGGARVRKPSLNPFRPREVYTPTSLKGPAATSYLDLEAFHADQVPVQAVSASSDPPRAHTRGKAHFLQLCDRFFDQGISTIARGALFREIVTTYVMDDEHAALGLATSPSIAALKQFWTGLGAPTSEESTPGFTARGETAQLLFELRLEVEGFDMRAMPASAERMDPLIQGEGDPGLIDLLKTPFVNLEPEQQKQVVDDPALRAKLFRYMRQERSEESLEFYAVCEKALDEPIPRKAALAFAPYASMYVGNAAALQVNISFANEQGLTTALAAVQNSTGPDAIAASRDLRGALKSTLEEVWESFKRDTIPRFVKDLQSHPDRYADLD